MDALTDGVWFDVPQELVAKLGAGESAPHGGSGGGGGGGDGSAAAASSSGPGGLRPALQGVRNLMASLLPPLLGCDPFDVGVALSMPCDRGGGGSGFNGGGDGNDGASDIAVRIYIYDTHGGGAYSRPKRGCFRMLSLLQTFPLTCPIPSQWVSARSRCRFWRACGAPPTT